MQDEVVKSAGQDHETAWLDWAWDVVQLASTPEAHALWCTEQIKNAGFPDTDPVRDASLRWPGYVGPRWEPGCGVLFIGSVHNDFVTAGLAAGRDERRKHAEDMAAANRTWRDRGHRTNAGDRDYLRRTQSTYLALAPTWTRSSLFGRVINEVFREETAEKRQ